MDERLFYSIVLLVSMMFLCLLISPSDRVGTQEKRNVIDLKSLLISQLLYPKIIAQISTEDDSIIPLKIGSEQLKIVKIEQVDDNKISIELDFVAYLNTDKPYAEYQAIYLIDMLGHIETCSLNKIIVDDDLLAIGLPNTTK